MSTKTCVWLGFFIGSTIGSYLPLLFGQDFFSLWSVILSAIGGLLGIWAGYRLGEDYF